jgi:hypothetical protein
MLADKRYCYPLTISDFASRYLITCEALIASSYRLDSVYLAIPPLPPNDRPLGPFEPTAASS